MKSKPHILILGGGAGGAELAARLGGRKDCAVTLVDRQPAHLWKPRLHEFAAGTIDSTLSELSYYMLARMRGFHFEQGKVETIDVATQSVRLSGPHAPGGHSAAPRELTYDRLVVALGGQTPDFGTKGVDAYAVRLDERADADRFRARFVAEMITARQRGRPAAVVIVGSGATGTELAAHLRQVESGFFRNPGERPTDILRILLVEAAPDLMPGADDRLRQSIKSRLDALDVETLTNTKIAEIGPDGVIAADGTRYPADISVWAAGLVGNPCLKNLAEFNFDNRGRIIVDSRLRTSLSPQILAIGDAACFTPDGAKAALLPTAQCASQQAIYLASAIPKMLAGKEPPPFVFDDRGRLVSLARAGSVGQIGFGRKNDFLVKGKFANAAYKSLQRRHQWTLLGRLRGGVAIFADFISPAKGAQLKLHR
ncbi:FAD-dependent oxidoreductase [Jiella sp. MQZ9-1]|uniref:FAD-dependent oxidoreductase n=1 Tax=Jiella flava TaxID=2816857 RepID=A0A939FWT1_9HYPH|nr:FAD-dependent oxidoreductase [Jiella flava]MBO0662191.1 FAD-dependent oxidoreductase [Jiella flava]MCD2470979.1 FAD-dependent oxidoreductase [Jiella flava]